MRTRLAVSTAVSTAVTALAVLAAGCGGEPSSEPTRSSSASPSSAVAAPSESASTTVQLDDASVPLAERLTHALEVVASGAVGSAEVREAALFEQTAARDLAREPRAERREVLGALGSAERAQVEADVTAARELMVMTDPQPELPKWRIRTPPTPEELMPFYRRAQRETGTPWHYLAAVHLVETRMGRIRGTSTAGAQGPMQFLPSTFAQYGAGGDINDPADAIMAAGRMLANNGAPGDMAGALWSYNHSDRYVAAVSTYAEQMKRSEAAYDLYWHWQVLYRHQDGSMLLPEGYPGKKAVRID